MDNLDLNIRNYSLEDIVNLFHIPINFNREHLKTAKFLFVLNFTTNKR